MSLSTKQIQKIAREGKKDSRISEAVLHEDKLSFHAKPVIKSYRVNRYFRSWRQDIPYALLPVDKADKVVGILSYPLATVDLTDSVFNEISRIFNAQNKSIEYEFTGKGEKEDFEWFLKEKFNIDHFMQNEVFDAYKWAINSIVVIDLPEKQESLRPEPYAFVLSIDNVLEAAPIKGGGFEYLVYRAGEEFFGITTEKYIKLDKEFNVLVDTEHNLGYVPAKFLWHKLISSDNPYDHISPITNVLGELDWFLFWSVSKKYNDMTGAFPIYVGYDEECDYEDTDGGSCDNGYINGDKKKPCPQCENKTLIGPGSMITVPAPVDKDDPDLGAHPVAKLDADSGSLAYCKDELDAQAKHIFESCAGRESGENVNVAKNKDQVASLYESRQNVLMTAKAGFEILHKWIVYVEADIRYGRMFKAGTINYGTEFYLRTLNDLYTQYTSAKNDGLPDSELDSIYHQIINVKYKNNDTQQKRLDVLLNLEPYPHKSVSEIVLLYDKGLIDKEDFVIKINFNSFVKRFERENGPIEVFGSLIDIRTRIENIYKTFKKYGQESKLPDSQGVGGSVAS